MSNNHHSMNVVAASSTTTTMDVVSPSIQQRRIEFHLARKSSSSFINNNSNSNFKLETLNPSFSSKSTSSSQSQSSSNSTKKSDSSEFFDAAFDLDFGFRIPFRRIGAGLENLGNTCFLNSVIQCLTYTEPLAAYLQSGKHQNTCHVAGFCALCAIQKHVNRALQSTGRILAPKDLVSNLRCISRNFRNARQEDAHEYMIHLLESMHKCCLPSGVHVESPGAYDKSLVHRIFGGRLRSQVKCLQCSHCSNTFDPFLDLSLEINKADSVHKALSHFTASEQLDGGERQYKCEKCKQKVRALKQLTVYKAPYVLTVHLKRFCHFAGKKIDKKVQFGSSLNLKPFVSGAYEGDLTYTLYGVLVHAGWSTHSGHYYCYVRTSSGIWYSLDDNRVYQVSERTVMEQKAYMLFYVRDRKNVAPKKAMDVTHKENWITTMRNASNPCSVPFVKSFQNGYTDKNSKESNSSGLVLKHSEGRNTSEVSGEQKISKCVLSNAATALEKDMDEKSNNTSSGSFVLKQNSSVTQAASSASFVLKQNSSVTQADMDGVVHPATKCSNGDLSEKSIKATASSQCTRDKEIESIEKPSISIFPSSVAKVPCNKDSQVVCTAAGTEVSISLSSDDGSDGKPSVPSANAVQPTTEDGIGNTKVEASESASSLNSKSRVKRPRSSSLAKSLETAPHQRLMKDIMKYRVGGTHLSTKMLHGVSLSLRKSKRFKRKKKSSKNVVQEHTEDGAHADMGPSTSDSNNVRSFKQSHKKGYDACDRGEKLGANCKDVDNSCIKERNSQPVNGVSSATIGLGESAVGRWDGVESPLVKMESNGRNTLTIGHVLDEWDEEYDRGKRKKVRTLKNSFGGPNVFQEIATKKAKLKVKTI